MSSGLLGGIEAPGGGPLVPSDAMWCADNGCFGTGYPGDVEFLRWLARRKDRAPLCSFAVAPDVVGDAKATLKRFALFAPVIRAMGFRVALAAQNGFENLAIPWPDFDVLFLGGLQECVRCGWMVPVDFPRVRNHVPRCPSCGRTVTEWKAGAAARELVTAAKDHGRPVHMGRVNSWRRLDYAQAIGCHSADGTCLARGPDINLPKLLGWLHAVNGQMEMWNLSEAVA